MWGLDPSEGVRETAHVQLLAIIGYRKVRSKPLAAIVLAGGLSSRMGADKALLRIGGERLIDRAVRIAGEVAQPVIVVASNAERLAVPGAVVIGDETPGVG